MVLIAPSILSADFLRLAQEIESIEAAGADRLHIDVMDGHFVPNLTFGPPVLRAIKSATKLPLDVHLMIENPNRYLLDYIRCGADILTIHAESCTHLQRAIAQIKDNGCLAGVALNPSTPTQALEYLLSDLDQVLIMSVNPGFSGQKFLPSALKKISAVKAMLELEKDHHCIISVDGGIDTMTASQAIKAGAQCLVAGSYIFESTSYQAAIASLKNPS